MAIFQGGGIPARAHTDTLERLIFLPHEVGSKNITNQNQNALPSARVWTSKKSNQITDR